MSCEGKGGKKQFEIAYDSCVFHNYHELRKPKLGQTLQVRKKIRNLHDPSAISYSSGNNFFVVTS